MTDTTQPTISVPESLNIEEGTQFIRTAISALGGDPDTAYLAALDGLACLSRGVSSLKVTFKYDFETMSVTDGQ